jgi:hypothetical protein
MGHAESYIVEACVESMNSIRDYVWPERELIFDNYAHPGVAAAAAASSSSFVPPLRSVTVRTHKKARFDPDKQDLKLFYVPRLCEYGQTMWPDSACRFGVYVSPSNVKQKTSETCAGAGPRYTRSGEAVFYSHVKKTFSARSHRVKIVHNTFVMQMLFNERELRGFVRSESQVASLKGGSSTQSAKEARELASRHGISMHSITRDYDYSAAHPPSPAKESRKQEKQRQETLISFDDGDSSQTVPVQHKEEDEDEDEDEEEAVAGNGKRIPERYHNSIKIDPSHPLNFNNDRVPSVNVQGVRCIVTSCVRDTVMDENIFTSWLESGFGGMVVDGSSGDWQDTQQRRETRFTRPSDQFLTSEQRVKAFDLANPIDMLSPDERARFNEEAQKEQKKGNKKSAVFCEFRAAKGVIMCTNAIDTPRILIRSGIGPRDELHSLISKGMLFTPMSQPIIYNRNVGSHLKSPVYIQVETAFGENKLFPGSGQAYPEPYPIIHVVAPCMRKKEDFQRVYNMCVSMTAEIPTKGAREENNRMIAMETAMIEPMYTVTIQPDVDSRTEMSNVEILNPGIATTMAGYLEKAISLVTYSKEDIRQRIMIMRGGNVVPKSSGIVKMDSVHLNLFTDDDDFDIRAIVNAYDRIRSIFYTLQKKEFITFKKTKIQDIEWTPKENMDMHSLKKYLLENNLVRNRHYYSSTARMGTSPIDSVVDNSLRVWGVRNLFIASPAVFPDALSVAPERTSIALGSLLAKEILELQSLS